MHQITINHKKPQRKSYKETTAGATAEQESIKKYKNTK